MTRPLFTMSDAELDRAVEAHYDRMYRQYYHLDDPEPCCGLCRYYDGSLYCKGKEETEKEADDCCDDFQVDEKDPDWMED